MKKKYRLLFGILLLVILFVILFYENSSKLNKNEITITNWNVQTFFDGNNDGIEYSEFKKSSETWNENFYEQRLKRLCSIIEELNSDVFVMEEIENEKILYDISNYLSHNSWFKNKMYNYGAFGKEKTNSIGCAVISKYKIVDLKFHSLDVRTETEKSPQMRAVMEVILEVNNQTISMFVNHWKSKSGGEEKTEKWRLWQENILAREWQSNLSEIIFALGDFNKDIRDFSRNENNALEFNFIDEKEKSSIAIFSPWDDEQNQEKGSYFFRGSWEKIDHFFVTDRTLINKFTVENLPQILKQDGTPARYELFNHRGFSDHLPITCSIKLSGNQKINP